MPEIQSSNTLQSSIAGVLRKRYKWLLGIVGLPGIGDLVRETARSKAMDYLLSKLGRFGDFLMWNPVALTEIGVIVALVTLTVMVTVESRKEIPSIIYEHRDRRFTKPPAPIGWVTGFLLVMSVLIFVACFSIYKHSVHAYHDARNASGGAPASSAKTPESAKTQNTPTRGSESKRGTPAQAFNNLQHAPSTNGGRRLSEAQKQNLVAHLKSGHDRRIVIYVPSPTGQHDRNERQAYASDLQQAFDAAKWKVIRTNSTQALLRDYDGLLFIYQGSSPLPDFSFLKRAFDAVGIKYQVMPINYESDFYDGATTADPVIYIGAQSEESGDAAKTTVKEFSYKQAIQIKNAINNLHLSPSPFIISTRGSEKDRREYANALQRAFSDAGWSRTTYERDVRFFDNDPKGVVFLVDDMGQTTPPRAITAALEAAHIKYRVEKKFYLEDFVRAGFYDSLSAHTYLPILWIGAEDESGLNASAGNQPKTISVTAPHAGEFEVDPGCSPQQAVIQITSRGLIQWQSPTKKWDDKHLYLDASDDGLTADVLVWCKP